MRELGWFRRGFERLLDAAIPSTCAGCDSADAVTGTPFCSACSAETRPAASRFVDELLVIAPFEYREPVSRAIQRFKYQNRAELARPFAACIDGTVRSCNAFSEPARAVLVPVPLHPERLATRGYNQSALLAQRLAALLGSRVEPRGLERRVHTRRQATLGRAERRENLEGNIAPRAALAGEVILVDDVVTTGATLCACAEAVRAVGAVPIAALCIAIKA